MAITGNDLLKLRRGTTDDDEKKSKISGEDLLQTRKTYQKYQGTDTSAVNDAYIETFVSDANSFLRTHKEDDNAYNKWKDLYTRAETISGYLYKNGSKLDSKSYESIANAIKTFGDETKDYTQFSSEDDFRRYKSGWLDTSAETNERTVADRQKYYSDSVSRAEALDKDLPWYVSGITPNFIENWFLSDEEEDRRDEMERLNAENKQYERGQGVLDKYYKPVTPEFTQAAANRNHINATKEDLWNYDMSVSEGSLALNSGGYFDEYGNIRDSNGTIVQQANAPVINDKLGMFLSASDDDITEAYSRLMGTNGNYTDTWANLMQEGDVNAWRYLKENEIDLYYYYLNTEGQKKAYEYLDAMTTELTRRETQATEEAIEGASVPVQIALNIASVPMNVVGGAAGLIDNVANLAQGKDINPYSRPNSLSNAAGAIREDTAKDIDTATGGFAIPWLDFTLGDAYQAGMSFADSAAAGLIPGGEFLLASGAATSEMKNLYERGASSGQIFAGGTLAYAAEAVFEHYSIGELRKIKNMDEKAVKNLFDGFVRSVVMGGVEASEEMATEIANTISDALVMGSQSEWTDFETFAKNVLNAGLGGFLSGSVGGGVASSINNAQYQQYVKEYGQGIINTGGVGMLQAQAAGITDNKSVSKLSEKVANKQSAKNVGRLAEKVQSVLSAKSKTAAISEMVQNGLTETEAKKVANFVEKVSQGYKATAEEIAEIESITDKLPDVDHADEGIAQASEDTAPPMEVPTAPQAEAAPVTENAPIKENAAEGEIKAPADVKQAVVSEAKQMATATMLDGEGNEVSVNPVKFAEIGDGDATLELEGGQTVRADSVEFKNSGVGFVYQAATEMASGVGGFNLDAANVMVRGVSPDISEEDASLYVAAFNEAYRYGAMGYPSSALESRWSTAFLSEKQRETAYSLGKIYGEGKVSAKQANIDRAKAEAGQKPRKKGKIIFDGSAAVKTLTERQKASLKGLRVVAEALGIDIHIFESPLVDGKRVGENGRYHPTTRQLDVDLHAGIDGNGLMLMAGSHELTHHIKEVSPAKFKILSDALLEEYTKNGVSVDRRIAQKLKHLNKNHRLDGLTEEQAYELALEEVVCDAFESMLVDSDAIEVLSRKINAQDKGLWETIKDFITKLVARIRAAYAGVDPDSVEGKLLRDMKDSAERLRELWVEALVDAADTMTATEQFATDTLRGSADGAVIQSKVTEALAEIAEGEGVLYSLRTEFEAMPKQVMNLSSGEGTIIEHIEGLTPTEVKGLASVSTNGFTGRDVRGYAMRNGGFTKAQINHVNAFMDAMADLMEKAGVTYKFIGLQDVENAKLHYSYNPDGSIKSIVLSAMVKNGDYPVNFDLSSICKKRVAMSTLIDKLAKRGSLDNGTVKLTPANIFRINTALKDAGYETACLGCFVESKRYNSLQWAKTFCDKWNAAVKKVNPNATYFGYGDNTFSEDSFTVEQAIKIDNAATRYNASTKTERLANAIAKYKERAQAGLPPVEGKVMKIDGEELNTFSKAARDRLINSDLISDELKDKYLNCDVSTLTLEDVEVLLETGILSGARLSNKQSVTEMVKSGEVYQHLLKPSDLLTDRGISKLEALPNFHGVLYGHYGSGTPKLMQGYTPYNSEIALLPGGKGVGKNEQSLAEYLYTIAGVRMQSFSDFQIQNIYDYLQMVADLAARKVPAHAYTKEISFAKLLGMTGIKVNLSVMFDIDPMVDKAHAGLTKYNMLVHKGEYAKIVLEDAQGKWVYNIGDYQTQKMFDTAYPDESKRFLQSIGFSDAVKLQTSPGYSANCGIIGVGYSDLGIFAMLDDKRVRYIIPYHASSLPAEIKVATHIELGTDYTPYQNNMKIVGIVDRNGNKVEWSIKEAYKRLGSGQAVINELNGKVRDEGWVVTTKKAQTGHGTYGLYEDLKATGDPKQTASNFMDWCIGNGTLPLFYQFASHENYYKMLYDYNVYDCVTDEYAPQQAVTNTYPTMVDGKVQPGTVTDGGFDTAYLSGTIDKQMAFMDEYGKNLDKDLEKLSDNMEKGKYSLNEWRFSDRDSEGGKLSEEQMEFFKDSAIRDEDGNLLVVYHGTNQGDFNTFLWEKTQRADGGFYGRGHYFTSSKGMAKMYGERVVAAYLNIKNPFVWDEQVGKHNGLKMSNIVARNMATRINMAKLFPDLFANKTMTGYRYDANTGEYIETDIRWADLETEINNVKDKLTLRPFADGTFQWFTEGRWWDEPVGERFASEEEAEREKFISAVHAFLEKYKGIEREMSIDDQSTFTQRYGTEITELLKNMGYDGAMQTRAGDEIVAFESNQIKLTTNKTPTKDSDIRYSDRDPDSYSNRSLLAGALETAVQNDIERTKLEQYKEKIDRINSEEQKLRELRAKIKKLSFEKGPRDNEALKNLQFEANQTANRINVYDRQLLDLESTKALKGVLEREKKLAYQKAEQRGKEALEAQREREAKTRREMMDRYQASRQKAAEGRNKVAVRLKIKNVVNSLNSYLLSGSKEKHVPIGLQSAVAEALNAVNMDTVGAEKRIAEKEKEMMRAKTPEAIEEIVKEIEHIREMGGNLSAKLERLKVAYDDILNSDDPIVANSYDEVISNTIARVIGEVGDTSLRDMSLHQLEEVYDMYKMILATVRNTNKAFKAHKSEEISTIANQVIAELDGQKKRNHLQSGAAEAISSFDWNNQKPVYAFERIGSDTFTDVFTSVREGEDVWARDMSEAKAFLEEQKDKYHFKSWDFDKKYPFASTTGLDFSLSLGQIMSLYAFSKRGSQATEHLRYGGFVHDGLTEIKKKGKFGTVRTYKLKDSTAYNLSEGILDDIISKLTDEQKHFADAMQDYLSATMGEKGNEVSLALYDVKLFKEKNYFPLKSAPQFLARAREQLNGDVKIKNKGFTKETKPKSRNPIVLSDFMDVWAGHVNEMSMYHAFALPLEDFYRVYNYKSPASETLESDSVISYLENVHGNASVAYIDQLLKDLNGGARSDSRENIFKSWVSNFKKAAVMASLSVVVQQPSAIVRAYALIDARHFVGKKVSKAKQKETWAEVKKYAPVAIIKEMGYFDTGMGQSSADWLKGEKTWKDKVDDVLSFLPSKADEVTWCAIWNAVKRETASRNPDMATSSEEFLKLAGERFTEVITKTQVYDSTLAKSANMRSKNLYMNMLTAFMAEPTTSINMLQDAFRKGGKKRIARAMGAVYGSVLLNSVLVSLVYAARDDDEDETYLEKYLSRLVTEVVDGVNPLTYLPFVKDIWSIAQGFDVERADMTLIDSLIDSFKQLFTVCSKDTDDMDEEELEAHRESVAGAILSVVDNGASLLGIPEKNLRREIGGAINFIKTLANESGKMSAGSLGDNIVEDLKDSVPVWGWFPDKSKSDKLYDAIVKGDEKYVDRLKSGYKDQNAVNSAIRKALRDNDPRIKEAAEARYNGDIAEYMKIAKSIIAEGHFKQDDVVAAINSAMSAMNKSEESSEASDKAVSLYKVDDYFKAIMGGDSASAYAVKYDLIETSIANGKDRDEAEAKFNSDLTSYIQDEYKSGNLSDYEAKNMLSYAGKTAEEADSKIQYWSFRKQYPDYDLTESQVNKYYSDVKPSGISVGVYYDYSKQRAKAQGSDLNGDGKTDSGSVKREVLQIIHSLPISSYQKDALYYLNGWSASTIWEAPWH